MLSPFGRRPIGPLARRARVEGDFKNRQAGHSRNESILACPAGALTYERMDLWERY